MGGRSPSPQRAVFVSTGNCVPHDTKASGEMHIPRRGRWLPAQLRSGASVRCGVYFFAPGTSLPVQPGRGGTAWSGHASPYNLILRLQVICTHTAYIPPARLKWPSPGFPVPQEPFPFFRAGPRRRELEGFRFFSAVSSHFQERIKTQKICCPAFSHPLLDRQSSGFPERMCAIRGHPPDPDTFPLPAHSLYAICAQMPVYQIR